MKRQKFTDQGFQPLFSIFAQYLPIIGDYWRFFKETISFWRSRTRPNWSDLRAIWHERQTGSREPANGGRKFGIFLLFRKREICKKEEGEYRLPTHFGLHRPLLPTSEFRSPTPGVHKDTPRKSLRLSPLSKPFFFSYNLRKLGIV